MIYLLIGFGLAIIIAAWAFSDARERGLDTGEAFLLFLGVTFMLIIVLPLWFMNRPLKSKVQYEISEPKLCKHCGKYYEGKPLFCPNCGEILRIKKSDVKQDVLAAIEENESIIEEEVTSTRVEKGFSPQFEAMIIGAIIFLVIVVGLNMRR